MRTVALDFDGVLHWYRRGWADGTIYDPPVPGSRRACWALYQHHKLVVVTTRAATQLAEVKAWLELQGFPEMDVTSEKVPATVYIDDRGYRFEGDWELALADVEALMEEAKR